MKLILLVPLMCGCVSWGLGQARGMDAYQREALARDTHRVLLEVAELAPETQALVDEGLVNCVDQVERAGIAQDDFGYEPEDPPDLRSPEDTENVQASAGMSRARKVRREYKKELPAIIAKGVAGVVKEIVPWWVWVVAFFGLGGMALVTRAWRAARGGLRAMVKQANDPAVKEHFKGSTDGAAQREYRRMREKGLL